MMIGLLLTFAFMPWTFFKVGIKRENSTRSLPFTDEIDSDDGQKGNKVKLKIADSF